MGTTASQSSSNQPVQVKIVADSAEKAVRTIKERFGERAKVLSVKQSDATGLKRFVGKQRLEVIVEVASQETSSPEEVSTKSSRPVERLKSGEKSAAPLPAPRSAAEQGEKPPCDESDGLQTPLQKLYSKSDTRTGSYFAGVEARSDQETKTADLGSAANPVRRGTLDAVKRAVAMLESLGFDASLVERIRYELDFRNLGELATKELYGRICDWLRTRSPRRDPAQSFGRRRVFVGGSGVGKTSALCKMLSAEVFVHGREPRVLKIDGELPNPSDGLEAFCEIMGAELARDIAEVDLIDGDHPLLIDMPGIDLGDVDSVGGCAEALEELGADERILVVNAAYETDLIAEAMAAGERLGATSLVFTHLDEARRCAKLWKYLLNGRAQAAFFSDGPNPAGDYTFEPYSYLLGKTFPHRGSLSEMTRRGVRSDSMEAVA